MMIPKRRLLMLILACLCFKKSFLIKFSIAGKKHSIPMFDSNILMKFG